MPTKQPDCALDAIDGLIFVYAEINRQARAVIAHADDTGRPLLLDGVAAIEAGVVRLTEALTVASGPPPSLSSVGAAANGTGRG